MCQGNAMIQETNASRERPTVIDFVNGMIIDVNYNQI